MSRTVHYQMISRADAERMEAAENLMNQADAFGVTFPPDREDAEETIQPKGWSAFPKSRRLNRI